MRPPARPTPAGTALAAAAVVLLITTGAALAQGENDTLPPRAEFALGIGYTRITLDGGGPLLEGRDAIPFEPVASSAPFPVPPQHALPVPPGCSLPAHATRWSFPSPPW